MGVVFLDDHNCVRFGPLRFWAERGLVHCEDSRDNSYESFSVRAILKRMNGISDMLANSKQSCKGYIDSAEFDRQQRMLQQMIEVCRQAQIQGMPSDAGARRAYVRARPKTFVVPDMSSIM